MSDELLTRLQDVIYNPKISREKRQEIQNVWTAIDSLDQHLREFENAIKLFEYSHQEYLRVEGELLRVQTTLSEKLIRNDWSELSSLHQELFSKSMQYFSWKQMAAREGAMIVFHYFKRRQRISHIVNTCSQLDRTRTRSYLKKANGILNEAFPSWLPIRDNVAHRVEFEEIESHRMQGPTEDGDYILSEGSVIFVSGSLSGCTYSATYDGRLHSYDLSRANLFVLKSAMQLMKEATIAGCSTD